MDSPVYLPFYICSLITFNDIIQNNLILDASALDAIFKSTLTSDLGL